MRYAVDVEEVAAALPVLRARVDELAALRQRLRGLVGLTAAWPSRPGAQAAVSALWDVERCYAQAQDALADLVRRLRLAEQLYRRVERADTAPAARTPAAAQDLGRLVAP